MEKISLVDTLYGHTTGKTYIDPETTQTIILDIAKRMEDKVEQAEEQVARSKSQNED